MDKIVLRNLHFMAAHGVSEQEKIFITAISNYYQTWRGSSGSGG